VNRLYYGDNLEILRNHIESESVDLVYIDPPFNSKRDYNVIYDGATAQSEAFSDTWTNVSIVEELELIRYRESQRYSSITKIIDAYETLLGKDNSTFCYLVNMAIRIVEIHRALKDSGSFYLHCDQTVGHYLKLILDEVFGRKNFRNNIIWHYRTGGVSKRYFARKHDDICLYVKNDKLAFFKSLEIKEYYKSKPSFEDRNSGEDENGSFHYIYQDDVFEIPAVFNLSKERLGYPTQKPVALLERIIDASCPENGVILDAFCGCGITVAAAQKLGRSWIGIDITFIAIDLIKQRMIDNFYLSNSGDDYKKAEKLFLSECEVFGIPKDIDSARYLATNTKNDRVRKEFEKWAVFEVGGVYFEKKGADDGIDGFFYIKDFVENRVQDIKCYIQVKSGKVGLAQIKEFKATIDKYNSPVGIFITLNEPTSEMLKYKNSLQNFTSKVGQKFENVYIVTVQDILDDKLPNLPIQRVTKKATSIKQDKTNYLMM
jgi:site-specific DNA-methyltransferase (adenine-specific)